MTLSAEVQDLAAEGRFEVRTIRSDATRAELEVHGDLDHKSAPLLAEIIEGHLRAGRRFLRLNVSGLGGLDGVGAEMLAAVHARTLSRRGTLVMTAVTARLRTVLARHGLADRLFLLAPCAHELVD